MRRFLCLALALCLLMSVSAQAQETAYAALSRGGSGQAVTRLQERLLLLGLLKGKADGLYGPKTEQAVKDLQAHLKGRGYALDVTGIADETTQKLAYDDAAVSKLLDLGPGDRGTRVSALQAMLYDLRLLSGLPDGDYGENTRAAVLRFQEILAARGVPGAALTGLADHVTRTALFGDLRALQMRVPQTFDDARPEELTGDDLYAGAAVLLSLDSGDVYLSKNASQRLYPASTTKIMTLLLALEKLPPDRPVRVPPQASAVPKDSSLVPLTPGEEMPALDLFFGLMLRSGNDAANAAAVLSAGSADAFVAEMNARAAALGLNDTHFMNPHGYHDPEHYTSAGDLARLSALALRQDEFLSIVSQTEWTMQATARRGPLFIRVNTDLFNPLSPFYYPGAFGVKSGYTRAAGFCYVGCASRDGRTLLAVVLNCRTRDQAWTDMGRLFNLGFAAR